jgi:RNA polymerase sigma factor (sigma-70 family)
MGWFRRGSSASGTEPGGSADLLTIEQFEALLRGDPAVLREFCVRACAIFRSEAQRRLAERGQQGRRLDDDLVQDLVEECLKNDRRTLRKWNPARGPLRYFLRLLAHRRIQDKLRGRTYGRSCERMMEAAELANRPQEEFEQTLHPEERDFWRKYQTLFAVRAAAEQQELYRCFYVEDEGADSLAARLGITVATLHTRLSRLRKFMFELRDELLDLDKKEGPRHD